MKCKLSSLQKRWKIRKDGTFETLGLCSAMPGMQFLTFADSPKFMKKALFNPDVSCILCTLECAEMAKKENSSKGIAISTNLREDFFQLHNELARTTKQTHYCEEDFPTTIGKDCQISHLAEIAPKNVVIGDHVMIESFVSIKEGTIIGNGSIIRSGTVLGGTGLEFIRLSAGEILPVTHCGKLIIGEEVEVQYNCNISRSLFPWHHTSVGDQTKIESLVHVAHGVQIGKRVLIAASACIGGSTMVGDDVWIGPNATLSSEIKVGQSARISLGAVVAGDVQTGKTATGNFAFDHDKFMADLMGRMR